jgi:ATP/maltotriose-dependent transcriptional regulator MalT
VLAEADVLRFVVDKSPKSVIVYDAGLGVVYQNPAARKFLARHRLPEEIHPLTRRLFAAIALKKAAELFPGRICFSREIDERRWVFQMEYRQEEQPLVCLYFSDETVSGHIDINALRQQSHLSRREADVLRHVLDGLNNQEIAEELGIALQTVKDHLSSIYLKHGVHDRFSLLRQLTVPP